MVKIEPFDFANYFTDFCHLFHKVYGRAISKDYCDWKFLNNAGGPAFGYGAWDGKKLIGFVSLTPYKFFILGDPYTAGQGADTMVDAEYRRQGLFKALTEALLEEMIRRRWLFRYSAPGTRSYPGYISKLHHQVVAVLPYYIKIRPLTLIRNKLVLRREKGMSSDIGYDFKDLQVTTVHEFDQRFDLLWEETKGSY